MSTNVNIQQFDGNNYQQFLPKSQAYNWGYEGNVPEIIRISGGSDEEFLSKLKDEFSKMPNKSGKQVAWQDHPAISGWTFMGTLWRDDANYGYLNGFSYGSTAWIRHLYDGVWGPFEKMALYDKDYAKIQIGSYTGTGTYGENSPNTLSFNFPVKYFMIRESVSSDYRDKESFKGYSYIFNWAFPDFLTTNYTSQNVSYKFLVINSAYAYIKLKTDSEKKSLSWYNEGTNNSAYYQFNFSNTKYFYLAIG